MITTLQPPIRINNNNSTPFSTGDWRDFEHSIYKRNSNIVNSNFVGKKGERIQTVVRVLRKNYYSDTNKNFYVLADEENNIFIYHQFLNDPLKVYYRNCTWKGSPPSIKSIPGKIKRQLPFRKRKQLSNGKWVTTKQTFGRNVRLVVGNEYAITGYILKHHTHVHARFGGMRIKQTLLKNVFTYTDDYKKKVKVENILKEL